jgi:sugar phosphate isomerase/epimerase
MFNFSCADFTFPAVERTVALRLVKLLGFDVVDVGLFARSTHFSPTEMLASQHAFTGKVREDLDAAELRASDIFLQIGNDPSEHAANDPSPQIRASNRDTFTRALEFCLALNCKHMTGLPGVLHDGVPKDKDFDLAVEETSWRVAESAKAGVRYAVEPHFGSICADVASARDFVVAVEGLTLTLDYGHFVMAGETSEAVHNLLPFSSHVHVRGGALGRLQTSTSENTIDFAAMVGRLHKLSYEGFLALEYVWIDWNGCNRTDNVSETVLLRRSLESVISALRSKHESN